MIYWTRSDYRYSFTRGLSKGIMLPPKNKENVAITTLQHPILLDFLVIQLNFVDYLEQTVHASLRSLV